MSILFLLNNLTLFVCVLLKNPQESLRFLLWYKWTKGLNILNFFVILHSFFIPEQAFMYIMGKFS